MKIVIDIPAEDFEKVKCGRGAVSMMRRAIIHGTPLPDTNSNLQLTCNQLATDCISRTELLKKQQIIIDEHGLEHKIVHIGKIIDAPSVEPEKCGDCISREAALDCLVWRWPEKTPATKIMELPSVEPERKSGKWIWDKRTGTYHCSECGHDPLHEDVGEIAEYKYCMNCGAEMEVDG